MPYMKAASASVPFAPRTSSAPPRIAITSRDETGITKRRTAPAWSSPHHRKKISLSSVVSAMKSGRFAPRVASRSACQSVAWPKTQPRQAAETAQGSSLWRIRVRGWVTGRRIAPRSARDAGCGIEGAMRAMSLAAPGPVEAKPLACVERPVPEPGPDEIRVAVDVCAVCRTDLHVVEGELAPRRDGHRSRPSGRRAGGRARRRRRGASRSEIGLASPGCGAPAASAASVSRRARISVSLRSSPAGTPTAATPSSSSFPKPLPTRCPKRSRPSRRRRSCARASSATAPTCAAACRKGGRLGIYGFGGSAHIVIQIARHHGCEVFVVTRGGVHRELAESLGATWVGEAGETPPRPLDGAILFAPAGELVPVALAALDRGATLAVAGIHLSQIPPLDYQAHLFQERRLCSVTANTRADGEALLALAAEIPIRTHTQTYPLEAANEALIDLKHDRVRGSALLRIGAG